jgi:hypothetical protein
MAESFTNSLVGSAGIVTTSAAGVIGAGATIISGISTDGIAVGNQVATQFFNGGAKVLYIGDGQVSLGKTSTNTTASTSQFVSFTGVTTCYTAQTKSILVGGTFANLTNNSVNLTVEVGVGDTFANLANEIPVPSGSSFVISEAGKTVLRKNEEIRVYVDATDGISVSLSILDGVS